MINLLKIFKKKPKPEYDPMRAFFTANVHSDKPIYFYIEGTENVIPKMDVKGWSEYIVKPKFLPDKTEIH
jgi:hypothetical protein